MSEHIATVLKLVVLTSIPLLVFATIVYVVVFYQPSNVVEEKTIATQFNRDKAAATNYYNRTTAYSGVCSAIGLPENVNCKASAEAYRFYQVLNDGSIYCADSTNFIGFVSRTPVDLSCQ